MNRLTSYLLAMALFVLIASPLLAVNVMGTIKSVDANQNHFVLTDQNGRDWTIAVGQNTQITTANNNQGRLQDLQPGQIVNVNYQLQNNQMVAIGINAQQGQGGQQQQGQATAQTQTQQGQQQQGQSQQGQQAAQQETQERNLQAQHRARGKIEKVNADQHQFTLKDDNGRELTFHAGRNARVEVNGKESRLADLQQGQEITVTYRQMLTDIRAGEQNAQTDNTQQGQRQQEQGQQVRGQIQQVQAAQHQLRLRDQNGREHTFQVGQNAQVQVNGRNGTLADLQQGQQVTATTQMVANDIRTGEQQNPNR
jgi:phosphotransferase system IIA component